MTPDQFRRSLNEGQVPELSGPLVALWHDARGDWDRAHEIVQVDESDEASWVHAYLHRKEGDLGNADYWYRRAGTVTSRETLEDEWASLVSTLLER